MCLCSVLSSAGAMKGKGIDCLLRRRSGFSSDSRAIERRRSVVAEQGPRYTETIRSGATLLDDGVADTLESTSAIRVAGQQPRSPNVMERAAILSPRLAPDRHQSMIDVRLEEGIFV